MSGESSVPPPSGTPATGMAYEFTVSCPQCGAINPVPRGKLGEILSCPRCGYSYRVLPAVQVVPAPSAVPPPTINTQWQNQPPTAYQPYIQYPQADTMKRYSWEIYPGFYPQPLKRRGNPAPGEFRAVSVILALSAIFAIVSVFILAFSPVILDFGGSGQLSGSVKETKTGLFSPGGRPVIDARLVLDNSSVAFTDSRGWFSFGTVKSGEHRVSVSKSGYESQVVLVFVVRQISSSVDVSLAAGGQSQAYTLSDKRMFSDWTEARVFFYGQAIVIGVLSVLMLAGAYFTWKPRLFGLVSVGGALAAFMWLFLVNGYVLLNVVLGIGAFLGMIAFIMILRNRRHYEGFDK